MLETMNALGDLSPEAFGNELQRLGTRRAFFVYDGVQGTLEASHPELQPFARALQDNHRDFDQHEAIFLERGKSSEALLAVFLHRTQRGQGQGGVRYWPYDSIGNLCIDGLRLARGMGRKNALAGLWWGGGKGIIARSDRHGERNQRRRMYQDYGRFVSSLRGAYVTAEDVGTRPDDMADIHGTTRFVTCIPAEMGGSGNPSLATARGVVCAMEAALETLDTSVEGARFAVQGTGNVGSEIIRILLKKGAGQILATDIHQASVDSLQIRINDSRLKVLAVPPGDLSIFTQPCDVFVPSALGGILNEDTIRLLNCRLVCGAANNQLLDEDRDAELLLERGIQHVPDFVANRMGIVHCANEQYGSMPDDPAVTRHFGRDWENSVHRITQRVLDEAAALEMTPTHAAKHLADQLAQEPHPIWPQRTRQIIQSLVRDRWHEG